MLSLQEELILQKFEELGLTNFVRVRNYRIREKYLKFQEEGISTRDIEDILSDEFFLAPETIHRIRYKK